jgi:hypothetical protein
MSSRQQAKIIATIRMDLWIDPASRAMDTAHQIETSRDDLLRVFLS